MNGQNGIKIVETLSEQGGAIPDGLATDAKQDSIIAIETNLGSLTQTLQELTARLTTLASMANSGQPGLRTVALTGSTTAVTGTVAVSGPMTRAEFIAANLTQKTAMENNMAVQSNINNVIGK